MLRLPPPLHDYSSAREAGWSGSLVMAQQLEGTVALNGLPMVLAMCARSLNETTSPPPRWRSLELGHRL